MGQEVTCKITVDGSTSEARALLETEEVILRGPAKRRIPFSTIREARAEGGRLILITSRGVATLELGSLAEKWAHKINNPRTLIDKLGVKPGHVVRVCGITEPGFKDKLTERGADVLQSDHPDCADLIFYQADNPEALEAIHSLRSSMKTNGAIWVITPRGRPEIADIVVMAAGKSAGLVDTKVCRFSDTHTALKFVIPVADRN